MLNELYQYALDHELAARPGFKPKAVKAYVQLTGDGRFVDITPSESGRTTAPDIGGLANGNRYCNILVEKALYPLRIMTGDAKKDKNTPAKHDFYLNALRSGAAHDAAFGAILAALSDEAIRAQIVDKLHALKYKDADPIGFEVAGIPVEQGTAWLDWWDDFRKGFEKETRRVEVPVCLITGRNAQALDTVDKVSGLSIVGGHASGDAFLCFDKDAFTSFGLKKSANAAVSEAAMTGVNAALRALVSRAPVFGGAKMVYWYSRYIPPADDPLGLLLDIDIFGDDEPPVEAEEPEAERLEKARREAAAESAARRLMDAATNGTRPQALEDARYYILPLSGMSGRVMVRGWYEGRFENLYHHVGQWYDDLSLVLPGGRGDSRPPKFKRLCIVLLKPGGDPKSVFDRMDKELSALLGRLFDAVINGTSLPDAAAAKALYTLRSGLMASGQDDSGGRGRKTIPLAVYQVLKCWLVRRQRAKGAITMEKQLNPDYPGAAYHCGRLMAVYAAIQQAALGRDIGAGVVERYYGAAIVSPRFVLGNLSRLSNYHLSKIENPEYALRYKRMLSDISTRIAPDSVPQIMSMEQQTEFALGYYQQNAAIYTRTDAGRDEADEDEN